jgi:TRAP-type C4-dicarboxylate transport system permease large subunit
MLVSQGSSPCSPFQIARMMMVFHVFVFLLVVCLLLSLASLLVLLSPFLLTRKGQAQHAPP